MLRGFSIPDPENFLISLLPMKCCTSLDDLPVGKDGQRNDLPKMVGSREYSSERKLDNEPYYSVNDEKNSKQHAEYKKPADAEKNAVFGGRLAEYKYYDTDQMIGEALMKCEQGV